MIPCNGAKHLHEIPFIKIIIKLLQNLIFLFINMDNTMDSTDIEK